MNGENYIGYRMPISSSIKSMLKRKKHASIMISEGSSPRNF